MEKKPFVTQDGTVIPPKEPPIYRCPSCGTNDPFGFMRCARGDCPDGRDPR